MPPSWIPLCRSMQLFCEPYFASINNWRHYKEESILFNRMKVAHTLGAIFHLFSNNPTTYKFEIRCQNEDVPLLPEVVPSAGREYRVNGDQIAFEAAMKTQPKELFQRAGVFFQDNLLKGIAGWSKEILDGANLDTRATIIECVNKLLRLSEEAGDVKIIYTVDKQQLEYPLSDLDTKALAFFQYIVETRQEGFSFDKANETTISKATSRKENTTKKKRLADEIDEEWELESTGVTWTRKHPSVGTQVAAHFPPISEQTTVVHNATELSATAGKLFRGRVVKYAPPSAPGLTDQLYHIRWEDGDEQDFDEMDMERGMDLFDQLEGWSKRHRSVGTRVAAYFDIPVKAPGGRSTSEQRLYFGTVTKYGSPLNPEDIPLYHVVYDDGDEQDINEHELTLGTELYKAQNTNDSAQKKAKKAKTSVNSPTPSVVGSTTSTSMNSPQSSSTGNAKKEKAAKAKSTSKHSSKTPTKKLKKEIKELEEVGEEEGEDDPIWTMQHHSIGKRVAQHFVTPGSGRGGKQNFEVYGGTVAVYAPPSAPRAKDQLYHIVWDDADEQDFDEGEFQHGLALLDSLMPTPLHIASDKAKALVRSKQKEMAVDYEACKKTPSKSIKSAQISKPETVAETVQETNSSNSSSSAEVASCVDDGVDIVNAAASAMENKVETMAEEAVEKAEAAVADTVLASSSVLQSATDSLAAVASATMSAIAEAVHVASDAAKAVTHQDDADPDNTEVDTLPATVSEYVEMTTQPAEEKTAMDVETVGLEDSEN